MDQAVITTFAGIGCATIVARSAIAGWCLRNPANWTAKRIARTCGFTLNTNEEWCLSCVGWYVGLIFGLCEYGWFDHNPLMDAFYLSGVLWILAEISEFMSAMWFGFVESAKPPEEK